MRARGLVAFLVAFSLPVLQLPKAEEARLARLAAELGAERDPQPISIDPDGSGRHGVVYDMFTGAHLAMRVAALNGTVYNPERPPASLLTNKVVVVIAVPLQCGDRRVQPTDVDIDNRGTAVPKWQPASGPTIQKLLPGAKIPEGAIAVQFSDTVLRQGELIKISYSTAVCSGTARSESFRVVTTEARVIERQTIDMPPGEKAPPGGITLNIAGVIDLDGALRYATSPDANTPLGAQALTLARKARFEPARVNGSPVPWTSGIILTFGVSTAAASDTTTTDVAGLTTATSKCAVSPDANYGTTGLFAIRIGGGSTEGAARIDRFMKSLRGSAGQGLEYRSTGKLLMRGMTSGVLEGVEVRYLGLAEPVRLYFDTSREEPLMAPKNFTCATPLE